MNNILVTREDLFPSVREVVSFDDLGLLHLPVPTQELARASAVVFLDRDGRSKVLKHRFGAAGISDGQMQAVRCAYADLLGSLEYYRDDEAANKHDWHAQETTIAEMEAAFPFLKEEKETV